MANLAYQVTLFAYQGAGQFAYQGSTDAVAVTVESGHGWLYKKRGPLPQYYRDLKIHDYRTIALPADETANAVAIEVLGKIGEIWSQLEASDRHFAAMLEQIDTISRQVATFIESRQIYRLVALVETRIRIEQQHTQALAEMRAEKQRIEDEEGDEFMNLF